MDRARFVAASSIALGLMVAVVLHGGPGLAQGCVPNPATSTSPSPSGTPAASSSPTPTPELPNLPTGSPTPVAATAAAGPGSVGGEPTQARTCPSTIRIVASPSGGVYGKTFTISGNIDCGGAAIRQADIQLERTLQGEQRWHPLLVGRSSDSGDVAFADKPSRNAVYRLRWNPDNDKDYSVSSAEISGITCAPATSAVLRVNVSPGIVFNIASNPTPRRGQSTVFAGQVLPAHTGHKVHLQALLNNKWTNVSTRALDSRSGYSFSYRRTTAGSVSFRVAYPTQHSDHAWNVGRVAKLTWR